MTLKKGIKLAMAATVFIGYSIGHMIFSEKVGEFIGEKLVEWVNN